MIERLSEQTNVTEILEEYRKGWQDVWCFSFLNTPFNLSHTVKIKKKFILVTLPEEGGSWFPYSWPSTSHQMAIAP